MSWFVKPETVRIDLPEGQWIEVKKRLSVGEERKAFASVVKHIAAPKGPNLAGDVSLDPERLGKAEVVAYLVDWSLVGPDGKPMLIDTDARKETAVDLLHPDKFKVISDAIEAHVKAMAGEEKNGQSSGENKPVAISPSAA